MAAFGAAGMIAVYVRGTLIQIVTPDHMRGRVSAVSGLFISGSNELGEFESGFVARLIGPVGGCGLWRYRHAGGYRRIDADLPGAAPGRQPTRGLLVWIWTRLECESALTKSNGFDRNKGIRNRIWFFRFYFHLFTLSNPGLEANQNSSNSVTSSFTSQFGKTMYRFGMPGTYSILGVCAHVRHTPVCIYIVCWTSDVQVQFCSISQ